MSQQPTQPAGFLDRVKAAWQLITNRMTPVPVGKDGDGLTRAYSAGNTIDKPYSELYNEINDSLDAWRKNPMARRIVNLVTAYVIGDGIRLSSKYAPLQRFINDFWMHGMNNIILRQANWCDELTRSGELFLVLFTNPVDGMSHIRSIPANRIDKIEWKPGDYEVELRYHEVAENPLEEGTWWHSFDSPAAEDPKTPIMLHFAINKPVGALRGESDLAPILPWLKRYSRWLEDRIRLNAGMRSFLWIVYAPRRLIDDLREFYRREPEPGSIVIAEEGAERWEAVSPKLNAQDAAADGRAIRWMIATGGPGTGLTDFGEAEDANLATATVMVDIRRRFLRRRQSYFIWMLTELTMKAFERSRSVRTANRRAITHGDFITEAPDISSEDNNNLATAVGNLMTAMLDMQTLVGDSTALRELALRMFSKFGEEDVSPQIAETIISEGEKEINRRRQLEEEKMRAEIRSSRQPTTRPATPKPAKE